jgi:small nuclear ribonucleoprotein (snRNP)-like protein
MATDRNILPARVDPAVRDLEGLLDTTWRVTLKGDERVFVGKFMVVDREVRLQYDTLSRLT